MSNNSEETKKKYKIRYRSERHSEIINRPGSPEPWAQFKNGVLETDDPELQAHLAGMGYETHETADEVEARMRAQLRDEVRAEVQAELEAASEAGEGDDDGDGGETGEGDGVPEAPADKAPAKPRGRPPQKQS